jgi:hypothetical protein
MSVFQNITGNTVKSPKLEKFYDRFIRIKQSCTPFKK